MTVHAETAQQAASVALHALQDAGVTAPMVQLEVIDREGWLQ